MSSIQIEEKKTPSRFDYVKYDVIAEQSQAGFKSMVTELETHIDASILCGRSKAIALTKLEELYMWIGKGLRNDQLARDSYAKASEKKESTS